jgi:hypothetical protein
MKKVVIGCMIFMSFVFAEDYKQENRILDMQKMAQAMQDIQSGFFYNNLDIVKAGAEDLKATIVKIGPIKEELENGDVYERWLDGNTAMTKRIQRKIVQDVEDIMERFADGDATQALQVYGKLSNECMKCHVSLRKW